MASSNRPHKEKVKPFRLVKYFTLSSLIVIFFGTLILSILNIHWARTMQREKSEDYALLLVENLNHQIFLQFTIPVVMKFGKIQLRDKEQFERMDKVVRSTLHSFKVDMVNIYDMNNTISYSFDQKQIGKKDIGGAGYLKALLGRSTSTLIQRGNFWEIPLGFPKESKLVTMAPFRAEKQFLRVSGPVLGVFEIIQDLSEDNKTIFRFQILVIITCAIVMGTLFLVLIFLVKKGEGIIQKRTLERLKLKEKLARAERLSSLGEMTAAISHEIRNPLGIIRSSAELLQKKVAQFDSSNTIPEIIIEESTRLNNIISDFLNYAKPKNLNLTNCRIEDILEKNLTFLTPEIGNDKFKIIKNYNTPLPEIKADVDLLYQAFLNILINSIQAMPNGGKIKVKAEFKNNVIRIVIKDEGDGIKQDLLEKIWDPFFTTKVGGTGLGLGIVKNIIESHGGTIFIENDKSNGARTVLELPVG